MRIVVTLLLLLAGLAAPLGAQSAGVLRGQVRSEAGEPLVAAVVEVLDAGGRAQAVTDRSGSYLLRGVPAGRRLVRASHLGYAPLEMEVLVPAGREVELTIALRAQPVQLAPVTVNAAGNPGEVDTLSTPPAELGLAGMRTLTMSPGMAELGLAEAAQGVPGQEPVDPTDVLYVRGAAADMKLVYLDGAPVYAPFPLGGLLDAFTPELLRAADVYLGGAPARYDGGLSYILDLRTRGVRADAFHSTGAVDLLSSRGLVELPLGERAGVLAAGRWVHGLGSTSPLPYGYREGLARADVRVGQSGVLSLTGFANGEEVWLNADASSAADSTIRWGNTALSLRYRGRLAGEDAEVTAAVGDFQAQLPLESPYLQQAEGGSRRARVSADLGRSFGGMHLRYGASFDRLTQSYRARWRDPAYDARSTWTEATGDVAGGYGDLSWQPSPRVRLRGGLRLDHFSLTGEVKAAPRLAATWLVTERAALTLAAGRYHQYLRASEEALLQNNARLGGALAGGVAGPVAPLAVGAASHLALSLDQELGEGVRLGVEGFFKDFQGMPGSGTSQTNASGADLWVRRTEGEWTGWLGYSLAWVWSTTPDANGSNTFAGRHVLSSGISAPLGERTRVDLRFAYGAGLPYTTIPLAAPGVGDSPVLAHEENVVVRTTEGTEAPPLLPTPDDPYLRFDVSASRRWSYGRAEFASYVKLLNTLGQRDALFYRYEKGRDDAPRALGSLPIVPVVGIEWRF